MKFGKRQLLVGGLVVALGAAVYLNWQFSGVQPVQSDNLSDDNTKQLGQTVYVNTEVSGVKSAKESSQAAEPTAAAVQPKNSMQQFFAEERNKRQETREDALAALNEAAASANSSESARAEAAESVQKMAAAIKAEGDCETEIRSKGFEDCIVSLNNDACAVIVTPKGMDDAAAITIRDIVHRQTGVAFDKITITAYSDKR